jgi:hypothetical protein
MSWFKSKSLVRFDMPLGSARTRLHKVAETLLDQRNIYILTILYPSLVQPRLDSSVNYELLCINLQFDHRFLSQSLSQRSRLPFVLWVRLSMTLQSLRVLNGLRPLQFRFGAHSSESVNALTSGKHLESSFLWTFLVRWYNDASLATKMLILDAFRPWRPPRTDHNLKESILQLKARKSYSRRGRYIR